MPPIAGPLDAARTLEAFATTVLGHGGPGDKTDGVARLVTLAISVDTTLGGHDVITTGPAAATSSSAASTTTRSRPTAARPRDRRRRRDRARRQRLRRLRDCSTATRPTSTASGRSTRTPAAATRSRPATATTSSIAGEDGERVTEIAAAAPAVAQTVVAPPRRRRHGRAGNGRNLVFGDNGRDHLGRVRTAPASARLPLTLGLVEAIESLIGGSDTITTGSGADIVIGGIDADTIAAGDGNNIVFGDSGLIDWVAAERGGALAGDDLDPADIDRIWSLDPDDGGSDTITTGAGDDIVIARRGRRARRSTSRSPAS